MDILEKLKTPGIDEGVAEFKSCPAAVLLDVRNETEYANGHIPGSVNLPLMQLPKIDEIVPDLSTPIFTYCLSGGRSRKAAAFLEEQGYTKVKNIGGINAYSGEIEE